MLVLEVDDDRSGKVELLARNVHGSGIILIVDEDRYVDSQPVGRSLKGSLTYPTLRA